MLIEPSQDNNDSERQTGAASYFDWTEQDFENDPEKNLLIKKSQNITAGDQQDTLANMQTDQLVTANDLQEGMLSSSQSKQTISIKKSSLSANDQRASQSQPEFHRGKKTCTETTFFCCTTDNDLNHAELRYFNQFKESMIATYSKENPEHEKNLAHLFYVAMEQPEGSEIPSDSNVDNLSMVTQQWQTLGFQQKNPRTDFRAGGHLGLLCLIYLCENYPHDFKEMVSVTRDKEEIMWLTAISSINMTHALMVYLYMNQGNAPPNLQKFRAQRLQFKKFCQLNSLSKRTFFILHAFGVRYLFILWIQLVKREGIDKVAIILQKFSSLVESTQNEINSLLSEPTLDVGKLVRRCDEKILELKNSQTQ